MKEFRKVLEQLENCNNMEEFIEQRKNECIEENKESKQNPKLLGKAIGLNRIGNVRMGGVTSASSDFIVENRIVKIAQGLLDNVSITTGDLNETYLELFNAIKREDSNNLDVNKISKIVFQTVNEYFGINGDVNRTDDLIEEDFGVNTLSMLKGKNKAACVERALLSQNLFKILGIDSTIKQSAITNNGREEGHAYNIIRIDGKNYIFDSALAKLNSQGVKEDPIVGIISDEEYMFIIDGFQRNGCKTQKMDNGIIYDSSFGTLEEELQGRSPEEIQTFRNQAKLQVTQKNQINVVDYYEKYGINRDEKWETIKEKLKKEQRKWIKRSSSINEKEVLEEVFQHIDEISEALKIFKPKNEEKRKQYDEKLEQQKKRQVIDDNDNEKEINKNGKKGLGGIDECIKNNPVSLKHLGEIQQEMASGIKTREKSRDSEQLNTTRSTQIDDDGR